MRKISNMIYRISQFYREYAIHSRIITTKCDKEAFFLAVQFSIEVS